MKKALVLVSRTWWMAGIEFLLRTVYLHRVGQLPALVEFLDSRRWSSMAALTPGRWVRRITLNFIVPTEWIHVYCEDMARLLGHCHRLQSVVHKVRFESSNHNQFTSRLNPIAALQDPLQTFEDLEFGAEAGLEILFRDTFLPTFRNLRRLSFALVNDDMTFVVSSLTDIPVASVQLELPSLETLVCSIPDKSEHFTAITSKWQMPSLRHLSITTKGPTPYPYYTIRFCAAHGRNLISIHLDLTGWGNFVDLFDFCPVLEHLVITANVRNMFPEARNQTALRRVDFGSASHKDLEAHFPILLRPQFANLEIIRLLNPELSRDFCDEAPTYDREYAKFLIVWIHAFEKRGIRMENSEGKALAFRAPAWRRPDWAQGSEYVFEEDDDSENGTIAFGDVDNDGGRYVTDSGDSDSHSSDYSGWDEDEVPDDSTGFQINERELDHAEAVEFFHSSVQVC